MDIINGNILIIDDFDALMKRECAGDSSLVEVRIVSRIPEIPDSAFKDCPNLERVILPEGLEAIQRWAFCGCRRLKSINLPSTVRYVGHEAFLGCSALEELVLPDGIFEVGEKAFAGCDRIKSISVPASLVKIGCYAFEKCNGLERVDVYSTIQTETTGCWWSYKGLKIFCDCLSIRDVVVHEGVTALPYGMFSGCGNIKSISLPTTLKTVNREVFNCYEGNLIVLPEATSRLGEDAVGRRNERVIAHTCCRGARYFTNSKPQCVVDFMKEGEARLQKEPIDVDGFCRWFLIESSTLSNDQGTRFALLAAMENHEKLLEGTGFVRSTDATSTVLSGFIRHVTATPGGHKGDEVQQVILRFLGEVIHEECHNDEEKGRKCALVAAVLAARSSWMRDLWKKPSRRGRAAPVYEAIAGSDPVACREFESMRKLTGCTAKFPDGELREAASQGRFSEFMLRLTMYGLKMDGRAIAKLFKCHSAKCIVAAYKNNGELEKEFPLGLVLLAVCQSWPTGEAVEFVKCVEAAFPGLCARTLDAAECSPLWYCLYNGGCYEWGMSKHPLVLALIEAGCDTRRENRFELSFDAINAEFTRVFRAKYPEVVARSNTPMGVSRSGATMPSVVVQKPSYAAKSIDTGTAREACPKGFVNALLYAGSGVIDSWRCAEAADIVQLWIPAEVKNIGNCAFKGCPNLEEVLFENCGAGEPLHVGRMAFADCPRLAKVKLSERLISLADGAFRDCGAFAVFSIPQHGTIKVGVHVFDNCPDADGKMALLS